ncbi:MAG: protein translocase subunit SecF [Gemmatimonadota bacterium]|jgi:preprotein translocase subunit SecF
MRFFKYARFKFIEARKIAYVVSGSALVFLLAGAVFWQVSRGSWLRYGVDFTGGTLVQVHFDQPTPSAEVRSYVSGFSAQTPEISKFGGENDFLIRVPEFAETGTATADSLVALIGQHVPKGQFSVVRTEAVGPKIGGELQQKALFAILLSFALTLIYLAFRFEWRFGVAAIIATFHDILITLGFISIMQLDISLPTVAAVLTIIGYSLNDTIVVFDRIRENLKKTGRREAYIDILNRSINEVLPRTVMTSGTTLAVLIALGLFGGAIIRDFALILIMGIVVGTYSSIFVASPALLEIEQRSASPEGKRARRTTRPAKV